jgi:3-deoxy-manno-octulosonate cytidylyltransferase (CMP-KDO synthetase)
MNFLGLIPARYGSTRFEGKPLQDICGKTMIQRVYEKASQALEIVYVATDDTRIADAVAAFGGKFIMTSESHENGTSRCLEAWNKIKDIEGDNFDVAINIQGDEPLLNPESIQHIKACFDNASTEFATLVIPAKKKEDVADGNGVYVTISAQMNALYFSRAVIPPLRNFPKEEWFANHQYYKHLGMYAYSYSALSEFSEMPASALELAEMLEQNRWIENGRQIKVGITHHEVIAVDTPEDLERVRKILGEV